MAKIHYEWLIAGLLMLVSYTAHAQYQINGVVQLKEDWEPKVYFSAIRSLQDLRTISDEFIISVSEVAEDGSFSFAGNNLPELDRLYRLHVCKKGDPASTIIIGGKDENHVHFVLNNYSNIKIKPSLSGNIFQDAVITGHPANLLLQEINVITETAKAAKDEGQAHGFIKARQEEMLIRFADTCSHPLPAFVALEQVDLERSFAASRDVYYRILSKWENEYNKWAYYKEFDKQIDFLAFGGTSEASKTPFWVIGFTFFGLILLFGVFFRKKSVLEGEGSPSKSPLADLSFQERKVYRLVGKGKSNKEISSELHIGVSTVKSHIHNIFKKLGLKSRKEVTEVED